MFREKFDRVYAKFKLHFYQKVFEKIQDKENCLTTVETFCMEIIYAANGPTVNEFAKIANLSSPNAAYKVNNLVKKGYLNKIQSIEDRREYHLYVTMSKSHQHEAQNVHSASVCSEVKIAISFYLSQACQQESTSKEQAEVLSL